MLNPAKVKVQVWGNNKAGNWITPNDPAFGITTFSPYLAHNDYIKAINQADVLLLFVTKIRESDILTGKVFEYMYFQKPILAIVEKDCELNSILAEYGNATILYTSDIAGIKNAILHLKSEWENNSLMKEIDTNFLNKFKRQSLTQQLADVFRECLSK
jgi:glycosyltransferase involved in cell wall biosynthesis